MTIIWISDVEPPSFGSSCPTGPLVAYAERERFSALVNWTVPDATDNSGEVPTVTSNYYPPRRFSQGTHVITYTALDQSGNNATCTFTIEVIGNEKVSGGVFYDMWIPIRMFVRSNDYKN